ncbi:hypothetical protein K461DRAFT_229478 [Myriangium duriaei CBS 260.36]|uniref:BTB domain-containing protein n=1 Tax=Myriangium duriaei CBS 260.36 TaxID=1168546 RepID=A0A9P4ME46_9PEZI|nr:hypothetical protein K461DRAFT_229478 [Myriangium duriaei CBS 260.36]
MVIETVQNRLSDKKSLPRRSAGRSPPPSPKVTTDEQGAIVIDPGGDLVLAFEHGQHLKERVKFRVTTAALRNASSYFRVLLDPTRFEEGRRVATSLDNVQGQSMPRLTSTQLPVLSIEDVGQISGVKSLHLLLADFLSLLHGNDLSTLPPPLANLANLTIVADRFDALPALCDYARSKRIPQLVDNKSSRIKTHSRSVGLPEEKLRQRCLIGLLLDHSPWLYSASQMLIQRLDTRTPQKSTTPALWQDLPLGIEDELVCRRAYLLDTIQSLQAYFLAQYTSRTRQCRLGYDSSAACDSFQLGEMVRFFSKIGTLSLSGALVNIDDDAEDLNFEGDLRDLTDRLRQCPEYQIDSNHHHCGLRTRLMPLLDLVDRAIEDSGIHGDLWSEHRDEYSWSETKRPLIWTFGDPRPGQIARVNEMQIRLARHMQTKDLCMAKSRVWEKPQDGLESMYGNGRERKRNH